ncbi:methyltransferase domain-containing protein [Brevundimonas sp.]|jgi:hypothetical protein|uniref:methyltransferase domain-containing protein n=1 Tax=Brevundimonas sp. TaxID=1871086 RepID=UPI003783A440
MSADIAETGLSPFEVSAPVRTYDQSMLNINVGCGYDHRPGYINVDMDPACDPDLLLATPADLLTLGLGRFENILAKDVLEHIERPHVQGAVLDWAALLKDGGTLLVQTSSIEGLLNMIGGSDNFEDQFNWMALLFGNQVHAGDFHHSGFTRLTLTAALQAAGFEVTQPFVMIDGWMWRVSAEKRRDWTSCINQDDVPGSIEAAYTWAFERPADPDGMTYYTALAAEQGLYNAVRQIFASPEHLYKVGAKLPKVVPYTPDQFTQVTMTESPI